MAFVNLDGHRIRYELVGPKKGIPLIFLNGLTQAAHLWGAYVPFFAEHGYRVLTFDMLGQGESDKPLLSAGFDRHAAIMLKLLNKLGLDKPFVAGISYGGAVALRYAILYPDQLRGLVVMGAFSELDGRLKWIGENLYVGLASVGTEYLQNLFMAYNFSSNWLEKNETIIPVLRRRGYNLNDQYALQNLMEAASNSPSFSHELPAIKVPTIIINGEYDYITPRKLHYIILKGIRNSRLVVVQHACHAFTLEYPDITCRLIHDFALKVGKNAWPGDQTVWVANDDPKGEPLYLPVLGDALRAIQPAPIAEQRAVPKKTSKPRVKKTGDKHVS